MTIFRKSLKNFTPRGIWTPRRTSELGHNVWSDSNNRVILRILSGEEIQKCVWEMHPLKAPSLDGFPGAFSRDHWEVVKDQVTKAIQEWFQLRAITLGLNITFLVIILKVRQPVDFSNFKPISLHNFCCKIISRILVNRLRGLLS